MVTTEQSAMTLDQTLLVDKAPEDCVGAGALLPELEGAEPLDATEVIMPPDPAGPAPRVAPGAAVVPTATAMGVG